MTGAKETTINLRSALIVDDDPIFQEILGMFLGNLGVREVVAAMDGAEAVEQIKGRDGSFGLIVCDINMPGKDGIEFLSYLDAIECRDPLLIASSAGDSVVDAARILASAYSLNLISTLAKPVNPNELKATLVHSFGRVDVAA